MNTAASLLIKNPNLSVFEIAHLVGYETTGKFAAAFRQIIGTTPLDYRKYRTKSTDNLINI